MFARAKRKGLPKHLRIALTEFRTDPTPRRARDIATILGSLNETFNQEQFRTENLTEIINSKLYRDDTVTYLIEMLPFFEQTTANAISTLLQSTIREFPSHSLPQHLMYHRDLFDEFLTFLDHPEAFSSICHTLFRACLHARDFTVHVYELGVVGSFTQLLAVSNFDRMATAFGTYDGLLTAFPDVSYEFLNRNWQIFQLQFKQLLASPNYLLQLNFLPILLKFLTMPESGNLLMRYLEDVENLQLVMALLRNKSKRVQSNAYSLFKLFVLNPRRADAVTSGLKKNSVKLGKCLASLALEGDDRELVEEKQRVLAIIQGLR
jgi:calcium binding protein 39